MKYKQKVEIEIEFEAGDIAEWVGPRKGDKVLMIVRTAGTDYMDGLAFYDNRGYTVPHNVTFNMTGKFIDRVRKVPESEWREW